MSQRYLRTRPGVLSLALAACCALACTKPTSGGGIYSGANGQPQAADPLGGLDCDPLVADECGFPFPSNVYLVKDTTTVTGWHVAFRGTTLPVGSAGNRLDTSIWANSDGFSPGTGILVRMPGVDVPSMWEANTLASPASIQISVTTNSPTILMEADTGTLVPHWTEIDVTPAPTGKEGTAQDPRTLIIHPAIRLKDNTRYIVAIQNMVGFDGKTLAPSPTFQALRDGTAPQMVTITPAGAVGRTLMDPTVEPRRALYADIFARLQKAGIQKSNLQIAWDYTTASRENNTRDLLAMRDDALSKVGTAGPSYTIPPGGIVMNPDSHIYERITGTMHVPLYLNQATDSVTSRLVRDPTTHLPVQNGYEDWPFIISVPTSVYNSVSAGGPPAPVVQQGHGLFGNATEGEGETGEFDRLADANGYVTLAIEFQGFGNQDPPIAEQALQGDINDFLGLVEPQHQGQLNQLLAMRMAIGGFASDPSVIFNGHPAIDSTKRYYRGDSQGGIMGAAYMAISTDVTRGYLGEPGMPYNVLLSRSDDFAGYYLLLAGSYLQQGGRDIQLVLGLVQMLWDRTEPDGYAPYITNNTLPNTPSHNVLLNVALGDFQVTPFGAYMLARTIGAQNLSPVPDVAAPNAETWGIPNATGPFTGNGMTQYNFHLDQNPAVTLPLTNISNSGPDNCDPHDKVRQTYPVFLQTDTFFRTGQIQAYCSGALLMPTPLVESCSADADCNDNNNRIDALCQGGVCVEPAGSCDFDYTTEPMTAPETPTACSPG